MKRCLTNSEKNIYLKYILGLDLESINPEKLFKIEAHLFNCEECFKAIQKEYEILKSISSWNVYHDNHILEITDFLNSLKGLKVEKNIYVKKVLIDTFFSDQFNYNQVEMMNFIGLNKKIRTSTFDDYYSFIVSDSGKMHNVKTNSEKNNSLIVDKVVLSEKGFNVKLKPFNPRYGDQWKKLFIFLLSEAKEKKQLTVYEYEIKNNEISEEIFFDGLEPGKYTIFTEVFHLKNKLKAEVM